MKIAYVTADPNIPVFGAKGASVHLRQLAVAFRATGQDVTIVAAKSGGNPAGFEVPVVEINRHAVQIVADTDRAAKERASMNLADDVAEALIGLHRIHRFDLIYERYSLWSAAGIRAARRLGLPCVMEVNAPLVLEQSRYREICLRAEAEDLEAEVFGGADGIFAVSQEVKQYAVAKGALPARCIVLPNGVDHHRFHANVPAQPLPAADGKFVIGFSGSLKPWHGIEALMETFRMVRETNPDSHLLVLGDGPLRPWIEGFARGAGLHNDVTVTGWIDHNLVPAYLQRVDVAVAPYPALDDFYFSPLKLYEYMAVGKPVVASRIGQIADAVEHGVTGLLAEPGDPADLAEKIGVLRRDRYLGARLGRAAAQLARAFTWERNAQRVVEYAAQLSPEVETV